MVANSLSSLYRKEISRLLFNKTSVDVHEKIHSFSHVCQSGYGLWRSLRTSPLVDESNIHTTQCQLLKISDIPKNFRKNLILAENLKWNAFSQKSLNCLPPRSNLHRYSIARGTNEGRLSITYLCSVVKNRRVSNPHLAQSPLLWDPSVSGSFPFLKDCRRTRGS